MKTNSYLAKLENSMARQVSLLKKHPSEIQKIAQATIKDIQVSSYEGLKYIPDDIKRK